MFIQMAMARLLCFVNLWIISFDTFSQNTFDKPITPNQAITTIGRVWGLLKYYHPQVVKQKLDWDQVLVMTLPKAEQCRNRDELATHISALIDKLGYVNPCEKCSQINLSSNDRNLNLAWLNDSTVLTSPVRQQLHAIVANKGKLKNPYVHWNRLRNRLEFNEQRYAQMALPDQTYRLLGLIRYWNIIEYFHPTKYLLEKDWNKVLPEFIPKFKQATDTLSYQNVLRQLISTIKDGHATFIVPSKYNIKVFDEGLLPPFFTRVIGDTLLVTGLYNDSLSQSNDIYVGDRIVAIEGRSISQSIDERSYYATASNRAAAIHQLSPYLLVGKTPIIQLHIVRQGKLISKNVSRYSWQMLHYKPSNSAISHETVPNTIGYIDVGKLRLIDIKRLMKQFKSSQGIIFDARTYPNGTFRRLSKYLNAQKERFALYTKPELFRPGTFKLSNIKYVGRENSDYYKGKVAILCNSHTQSAAESTCLALRTAPKAKIIGSQSAGANGDVSYIVFPGDYQTSFTGTGVYTPEGIPVQGNGVPIDISVNISCSDALSGNDKILETAINWIKQ